MTKMTMMRGSVPFCAVVAALVAVACLGFVPSAEAVSPTFQFTSFRPLPTFRPFSGFKLPCLGTREYCCPGCSPPHLPPPSSSTLFGSPTFEFRNCYDYPRWYSVGYKKNGKWTSEGHWKVNANSTSTYTYPSGLDSSTVYYRTYKGGDALANGKYENRDHATFCIRSGSAYTHTGDDCRSGYSKKNFAEVPASDIGSDNSITIRSGC